MLVTVFIDHEDKIPKLAEVTGFPEDLFLKVFNEDRTLGKYCRIRIELSEEQARQIESMRL